ncbi:hypothetical protein VKT23_020444 [Stygiomarasmius scandens]|uniref:Autophagy-related protein 14 n=1 Tax=Marasmiellus scandens TaxID=2682957 RepID=A0ABR1IKV8_9AGAR
MECKGCQYKQHQFYCAKCINGRVKEYRLQTQKLSNERDDAVAKATRGLESVQGARTRRANVTAMQARVDELMSGLSKLRKDNDKKRTRLQTLRETLATRRQALSAAKLQFLPNATPSYNASKSSSKSIPSVMSASTSTSTYPSSSSPLTRHINQCHTSLSHLQAALMHARNGLVAELVEVFHIVQLGGRPAMNGRPGVAGEWSIANLVLPVPGDVKRYPTEHINAVLTNTIRFVELLGFYLGVKMPFEVSWSGRKLGVGVPWIGSVKGYGGTAGEWARWHSKYPLHLTNSSSPLLPPQSSDSDADADSSESTEYEYLTLSPERKSRSKKTETEDADRTPTQSTILTPTSTSRPPAPKEDLADSMLYTKETESSVIPSFTTALTMLLYNVCYLAYTQNVDIPLAQAGDVLGNLWAVCCSAELGRRSHETRPHLPPPTPAQFQLDFGQLLQATAKGPRRREAVMRKSSGSSTRSSSAAGTGHTAATAEQGKLSLLASPGSPTPIPRPGSDLRKSSSPRRRSSVSLAKDVIRSGRWGRGSRDTGRESLSPKGKMSEEEDWDIIEEESEGLDY